MAAAVKPPRPLPTTIQSGESERIEFIEDFELNFEKGRFGRKDNVEERSRRRTSRSMSGQTTTLRNCDVFDFPGVRIAILQKAVRRPVRERYRGFYNAALPKGVVHEEC